MSESIGAVVAGVKAPKSAKESEPKAKAPKSAKESKPKKVKVAAGVDIGGKREYTDSRYSTPVVQHSASYTFKCSGAKYSVSAVLRALGYYCNASGPQGKQWCDSVGLPTNASTCGQQCGAGRRHEKAKGGKPDNEGYGGWHGSVPVLTPEEKAELKKMFEALPKE